jgi:hypothetical protein
MPAPMGLGQGPVPGAMNEAGKPPMGSGGDPSMGTAPPPGAPNPEKQATMGKGPKAPTPPGAPSGPQDPFDAAHAQFTASSKVSAQLKKANKIWQGLVSKGDSVQPEDVMEAGGDLVGVGATPQALAQTMADMPSTGGQGLAGWVQQHGQTISELFQAHQDAADTMGHLTAVTGMQRILQVGQAQHSHGQLMGKIKGRSKGPSGPAPAPESLAPPPPPNGLGVPNG